MSSSAFAARRCAFALAGLLIGVASAAAAAPAAKPADSNQNTRTAAALGFKGEFLPDTAVLARIGNRTVTARGFVEAFFNMPGNLRPRPDSSGRVEFLNTLVTKDVMGQAALASGKSLTFEDRAVLKKARDRSLSNALYIRYVWDSVTVSDAEVRREYEEYKVSMQVRRIVIEDLATAAGVRNDIVAGRTKWDEASKKYARPSSNEAETFWIERRSMDRDLARQLLSLRIGGISSVIRETAGFSILQVVGRKEVVPPEFELRERFIRGEIRQAKALERAIGVREKIAADIDVKYDSTNIAYAIGLFPDVPVFRRDEQGPMLDLAWSVPHLSEEDRGRVLARHKNGSFTLGEFVEMYGNVARVARQPVGTFEGFRSQLDLFVIEPYLVEVAEQRGLDKDPMVVEEVGRQREKLLVEHLYRDSVMAHVRVTSEDCKAYYDAHKAEFVSTPRVRYAHFVRPTRASADSVERQIKAGAKPEALAHADSAAGRHAVVLEAYEHERGPMHKLLFEEMGPGNVSVFGPDDAGLFSVIVHIQRLPGRPVGFAEAEHFIYESLRNERSEKLLGELIARQRSRFVIETHPELVASVLVVDPILIE
jgi:hypothetical protein